MHPITVRQSVIVADDSSTIRDNVRAALGVPWQIFLAADGVEAIEYARGVNAELVMLDFRMPRLDGIDACASIRGLRSYASVPIVLLTAYDSVELRRRALAAGATAVFSKPFSANALRQGVLPLIALGRDAAVGQGMSGSSAAFQSNGDLSTGRDVIAVHRQVEAAAKERRHGSFVEIMAERRAKSRS